MNVICLYYFKSGAGNILCRHWPNLVLWLLLTCTLPLNGQALVSVDTLHKTYNLGEVEITSNHAVLGMGQLKDEENGIIYAGKKTEVLLIDSLNANTAQNNPRQVMGKLPGAVFTETEGSGLPANGIALRGLNPYLSVETNTRQDGYNISADLFGYNDAYYVPPFEAVEQINVVRGAASLQYGPQFGGAINYILRQAPVDRVFEFNTEQTLGSYGFFNSYNSAGGSYKGFSYFSFFDFSTLQGWRPNSDYRQYNGFVRLQYKFNENVKIGAEYTMMQNRIHMPGGLDDAQFDADPQASYRARNWLSTPWNILALNLDAKLGRRVKFTAVMSFVHSQRNLLWFPEYSGAGGLDTINPATGQYSNRQLEVEKMRNFTTEARLAVHYNIANTENTFTGGIRFYYGWMARDEDGIGTTGADFNFTLDTTFGTVLTFTTVNVAPFFENMFRVTKKFTITPGFRFEYIHSTISGYSDDYGTGNAAVPAVTANGSRDRYIPLAGIALQYVTTSTTQVYANISQAYRPIDYDALTPFGAGSNTLINPDMKDASGFNSDIGYRGTIKNYLIFDANAFVLWYKNTIGIEEIDSGGQNYDYRTNIGNSLHTGLESYIEFWPFKCAGSSEKYGQLSFFNSFSYIHAQYLNGQYNNGDSANNISLKGKWVENAPQFVERCGLTYSIKSFSITCNLSYTSLCYTDANNTILNPQDATIGIIPAYMVMDVSASYKFLKRFNIKGGINNLANARYFTLRVDEYPGPGIIPANARSFYIGIGAKF